MLKSSVRLVRGVTSVLLYTFNTFLWVPLLLFLSLFKFLIPFKNWRAICDKLSICIGNNWILINNFNQRIFSRVSLDVKGMDELDPKDWYMVVANHQSTVDILVLQNIFYHKIPFLKFFLKKELLWFPVLGQAWWALDFPFMKRYSNNFIIKNPHLKGKDLEITKKACEKFKKSPVSIMNFVEGTRFTDVKHKKQKSPYENLLRPRAGGIAFVLSAMNGLLSRIIDVTIVYPKGVKSFWALVCGDIDEIKVRVKVLPINNNILGDYIGDNKFRDYFQAWLNNLWAEKDEKIRNLLPK